MDSTTSWWRRPRWRRIAPALLPWSAALTYLVAWPSFGSAFAHHLLLLMELEFVALHAGAFLGMLAIAHPRRTGLRLARWMGLAFFGAIYAWIGWEIMGFAGIVEIVLVLLATYGGLLFGERGGRVGRAIEVGSRWLLSLILFMLIGGLLNVPTGVDEWTEARQVLLFGALYFAALGGMEWSGVYPRLRRQGSELAMLTKR